MKIKEIKVSKAIKAVLIVLALALVLLGLVYLVIYLSGYRIIRYASESGETRFFGKVGKDGQPMTGTVYFADGTKADVDMKNNRITYSDKSEYVGETTDLIPDVPVGRVL